MLCRSCSEVQNLDCVERLGDANKYVLWKQSIIMCERMTFSEEHLMVEFLDHVKAAQESDGFTRSFEGKEGRPIQIIGRYRVNFSYAGSFS